MRRFELSATVQGEWAVLAPCGEVDLATAPAVRGRLHELADGGARHLVVDLARVGFLDSVGLGVLLAASRRLRDRDPPGSLRLAGASDRVARVLELTGLLGIMPVHASVEAARAAADPPAAAAVGGAGDG